MDRALRQFALESMPLTSTDEAGIMTPRQPENDGDTSAIDEGLFWDDPYSFLKPAGYARKRPPALPAKSEVLNTSQKSTTGMLFHRNKTPQ